VVAGEVIVEKVPIKADQDGVIRVSGTRVPLETVIRAFLNGAMPEQIVMSYDSLPLADVYQVIAYYLKNKEKVDAYLAQVRAREEETRKFVDANWNQVGIRERLLARQRQRQSKWLRALARRNENFNNDVLRGIVRREPSFDIIRAQDAGLGGHEDPLVLTWAAEQGRIVLTHDFSTMPGFAHARVREGLAMPGLVQVDERLLVGIVIEELLLMDGGSRPGEWEMQVVYLPLR
jgi:uncharacterized protein (DUF433 family)